MPSKRESKRKRTQVAVYEAERADEAAWQASHVGALCRRCQSLDGADLAQVAKDVCLSPLCA